MAAASMVSFLCAILILSLLGKGFCQPCTIDSLQISQYATMKEVQGKAEYKVTIKNNCICTQGNVILSSPGFSTVEKPDASVVTVNKEKLLELTQPLYGYKSVDFNYAWDKQFSFKPESSTPACS